MFELPSPSPPERVRQRRSKRKRRWHQRLGVRILAVLLLVLVAAIGYVWIRLDKAMTEINSLSTLPPQIQDHTASEFDGTPVALQITVPARSTPSGPPPTIVAPKYEGVSPGGPVRQTAVALIFHATPVAAASAATPFVEAGPGTGSPVSATPIPAVDAQTESMLVAGLTFDTGPAKTAIAEFASEAQSKRTPTPSGQ